MARLVYVILLVPIMLIGACNSSKINNNTEEKIINQKLKKLKRNPLDLELKREIEELYFLAVNQHQSRLDAIESITDFSRYDRIIREYGNMQKLNDLIRFSSAGNFLLPSNYYKEVEAVREEAASILYQKGLDNLQINNRTNLKEGWSNFKRIKNYVPSYRDTDLKIKEAFQLATINIVINPVQFRQPYRNVSTTGFLLSQLPDKLVSDIGSPKYSGVPAKFHTHRNRPSFGTQRSWELDITWVPYQLSSSGVSRETKKVSGNIKDGVDSLGKQLYKTVHAVINIERKNYNISGGVIYFLNDLASGEQVSVGDVKSSFTKYFERARYSGDSRALSTEDWNQINNRKVNYSDDIEIEEELLRRIYPELLNKIRNEVDW